MRTHLKPFKDPNEKYVPSLWDRFGTAVERNYQEVILSILVLFGGMFIMIQIYRYLLTEAETTLPTVIEPMVIRDVNELSD